MNEITKLRMENAQLRAENKKLAKKSSATATSNVKARKDPWAIVRTAAVVVLVVLSAAVLALGNLVFWTGNTIVKPDRFVAATSPIIKDPDVQHSLSLYTTNSIFNAVNVQKVVEGVLPPRADFLAPQLANQLESKTQSTLQGVLAKPSFQDKWNKILATQHARLISFSSKYKGDGSISLNDVYNQLDASLVNTKLAFLANKKLPAKIGNVTVVNATWLPAFHNVVTHIDTWRILAIVAFVLMLAAAVWLSKNRRRSIYTICILASGFMLAILIALRVIRQTVLEKVDPQYVDGVRSAIQIFFHSLVIQTVTIFLALILLGFVAWVSGTSKNAVALKNKVGLLFSGKLHNSIFGEEQNSFVGWVERYKHLLEWIVVAVFVGIMLLVRLTIKGLIIYSALILISVLGIEVIGGKSKSADVVV